MKTFLRILLWAAAAAMAAFAARELQLRHQFTPRDIPVLMYHNVLPAGEVENVWQVSVEEFARQMDDLDRGGFTPILPHDIVRASLGRGWLPRKPVVITFDDGYEGVMRHAEPILREHGFRAICYAIVARLGSDGEPRTVFDSGPLLTTNEAAAMSARGTVAVGIHSLKHRPNWKQLTKEIRRSRTVLFERTGIRTTDYCYPFGIHGYPAMRRALADAGFRSGTICDDRMFRYRPEADLLEIPRLSVYGGLHSVRIAAIDREAGTVTVANDDTPIPLKVVVRSASGTVESGVQRVGGDEPTHEFSGLGAIPADATVELTDAAGLFRYDPPPEPST